MAPYQTRLLYLIKRHGPQEIPRDRPTLVNAASDLIDWQVARYNGAGLLELIPTTMMKED